MLVLAPAACCLAGAGLDSLLSLCLASLKVRPNSPSCIIMWRTCYCKPASTRVKQAQETLHRGAMQGAAGRDV